MTKKEPARQANTEPPKTSVQWVCGIYTPPEDAGEEPAPTSSLLWLNEKGKPVGLDEGPREAVLARAGESLHSAQEKQADELRGAHVRVRVAEEDLAQALRGQMPALEVTVADTPEITPYYDALGQERPLPALSQLGHEPTPEQVGAFFEAAAAYVKAKPWDVFKLEQLPLGVFITELDLVDSPLQPRESAGQGKGWSLFESWGHYVDYVNRTERYGQPGDFSVPGHLVLEIRDKADVPAARAHEQAKHGWPLAGPDAFPWLATVDEDLDHHAASAKDYAAAEAICRALTEWAKGARSVGDMDALPEQLEFPVSTEVGQLWVHLETPCPTPDDPHPTKETFEKLLQMEEGSHDPETEDAISLSQERIVDSFCFSPEFKRLEKRLYITHPFLECGYDYLSQTVASMGAQELEDLLFDILPRHGNFEPADAADILRELSAFYAYLKRVMSFEHADANLNVLRAERASEFREALADESRFGGAKSLVQLGAREGFDMTTVSGISAFLEQMKGRRLPDSFPVGRGMIGMGQTGRAKLDPKAARKAKNAKKAKRKARKKAKRKGRLGSCLSLRDEYRDPSPFRWRG